ncbi:putative arca-like protein [Rosellinia necatrix]|uniref:Putative arca-like protein n=1 Tax=Rosellinia necatrix TaxID=77044 RepID=A0A1W2TV51_ROSNE|nr:putative arca-like protein [Rosellinia necatrix]
MADPPTPDPLMKDPAFPHIGEADKSIDEREFEFPTKQQWCIVAGKRLAFIDETVETTANHAEGGSDFDREFDKPLSPIQILSSHGQNTVSDFLPPPSAQNSVADILNEPDHEQGVGEAETFSQSSSYPEQSDHITPLLDRYASSPEIVYNVWQRSSGAEFDSHVPLGVDSHPHGSSFTHLGEAELMRYYIDQVAPIFDLYDREMNFARSVPEAAGLRPELMNIISIVATKHRECFYYHQSPPVSAEERAWCVRCLERALTTSHRMLDGCVLATIVLLRFIDVIETTTGAKSHQCKSAEIRNILEAQSEFLVPGGLHQAAFWAAIRQEIYLAILHERPTTLHLDKCNIDLSLEDAEDEVWMGRITLHLVDVLGFCFGSKESDSYTVQKYDSLIGYLVAWAASKPEPFEPLFTRLAQGDEVFPEIVFLSDCAMAAWHCYHLTRMLLIAHNPRFPRMGSSYMATLQSINHEIKRDVLILCGIAETPGNSYRACPAAIMGIVLAGDRFTDRQEQQALFGFLVKVEKNHAWPTRSIQQEMKEAWGWSPSR